MKEWEHYGKWLLQRVGFRKARYHKLMDCLHNEDFISRIGRDANRENDGMLLRNDFCDWNKLPIYLFDYQKCSVLEMLVALAIRMDDEYIGDPANPDPSVIFWEMIYNLGLDKYTDGKFHEGEVHDILYDWMCRDFGRDGTGSIFPLKHPRRDQTKIEIWDQMNEYLSENY